MKIAILLTLLFLPVVGFCQKNDTADIEELLLEPNDSVRRRTVPLKVYFTPSDSARPVILFSHGLGGSREGNPYLGKHWAANGYIAVFMQHPGSDRGVWESVEPKKRMEALKKAAGSQTMRDRLMDVPFVIDRLEKWNREEGHPLYGMLDLEHIGLAGHSAGAFTTMGMAGRKFRGRQTFRDERIDAFLAMSPNPGKGLTPSETFGHLTMPILCMTGTEDGSPIDPDLEPALRQKVYAGLPPGDKYQLVFEGAHHFAFGDGKGFKSRLRNPRHHPAIQLISTRFWDAYLKDDESAKLWLQSDQLRKECNLVEGDSWEWK